VALDHVGSFLVTANSDKHTNWSGAIYGKQTLGDPGPSKEGYEKLKEIDY
jgi:hypothetical protein